MVAAGVAWALLTALYLAFAGQAGAVEAAAGLLAGLAGALLSLAVRRTGERRFRFRGTPWLRVLGRPLLALVTDAARVGGRLLRAVLHGPDGTQGAAVRQPFRQGGAGPGAAARRGLATLAVSFAPNSYVLRIAEHRDEMELHRLAEHPSSPDRDWPA